MTAGIHHIQEEFCAMRMRKKKNLLPRMEACSSCLVRDPFTMRGQWRTLMPDAKELRVELGCGKGRFTVDTALSEPDVLLIAVEKVPDAMVVAMERAMDAGLKNVFFVDGDAALLYLYILRHGGTDGSAAARALRLSADRYERAAFTLNNLIAPTEKTKAATDKSAEAPRYTGDELRRARLDDQTFSGLCDAAEGITGRALTEGQLRCLLTIYDYLGLHVLTWRHQPEPLRLVRWSLRYHPR